MPLISIRTITDSKTIAASKAPTKYFTQSGVAGDVSDFSGDWDGASGDDAGDVSGGGSSNGDGGLVVKAPTALQAL